MFVLVVFEKIGLSDWKDGGKKCLKPVRITCFREWICSVLGLFFFLAIYFRDSYILIVGRSDELLALLI